MRALGVDLSLASCGLAVVERTNGEHKLLFVATVKPDRGLSPARKRAYILKYVAALWQKYMFGAIVFEQARLFTGKHGQNVPLFSIEAIISLSTTIEDWALREQVQPVIRVATNSWRKVVLGSGRAKKKNAIDWVKKTFDRDLRDDAAEAVCQACYGVMKWKR